MNSSMPGPNIRAYIPARQSTVPKFKKNNNPKVKGIKSEYA